MTVHVVTRLVALCGTACLLLSELLLTGILTETFRSVMLCDGASLSVPCRMDMGRELLRGVLRCTAVGFDRNRLSCHSLFGLRVTSLGSVGPCRDLPQPASLTFRYVTCFPVNESGRSACKPSIVQAGSWVLTAYVNGFQAGQVWITPGEWIKRQIQHNVNIVFP